MRYLVLLHLVYIYLCIHCACFAVITHHLPTELKVLASSGDEKEATFSCFAKDFSPKDYEIKWLKNDVEITDKLYEIKTPTEASGTNYSAASFLVVKVDDLKTDSTFTCEFNGKDDKGPASKNSSITYMPSVEPCQREYISVFIS